MVLKTRAMEHEEKDLGLESAKELTDQVEKELKWKQDTEITEIVGKENIEIIEWSERQEDTTENGRAAESETTEDLLKTNIMMRENGINVRKETECESKKSIDMNEEEKERELNLEEVEKEFQREEEEESN